MKNITPPYFSVAYYPESRETVDVGRDLDKMKELGFNCVRVGEFAWSSMEKRENEYDFSLFQTLVKEAKDRGIAVIMCTPTAAPPRWAFHKYPEISAVDSDGVRTLGGERKVTCANSKSFIRISKRIVEELAKTFSPYSNIIGWQIDNETLSGRFGGVNCCCERCVSLFRENQKKRFGGDIEKLNTAWGMRVWSQDYSSFDEIDPPKSGSWNHPSLYSAWKEFQDESERDFLLRQYKILKKYTKKPIGHNGFMYLHGDFAKLTADTDIAMLDEYVTGENLRDAAFWTDYYRTLKSRPYWLMETSPSWNGDTVANYTRPRGFNRANVWLGYFSGAELVGYWLWQAHYGGQELMHGSVLSACGQETHVCKEVKEIKAELEKVGGIIAQTRVKKPQIAVHLSSRVARTFANQKIVPEFDYYAGVKDGFYLPISRLGYGVDVISPYNDLKGYKLVFSPFMLWLNENGLVDTMLEFVENGGIWIVGPMSDIRTKFATKYSYGEKGFLESLAGARVEFYEPCVKNIRLAFTDGEKGTAEPLYFEALETSVGKSVCEYENGDFLKGFSAIVEREYGEGKIVLLGCMPSETTMSLIIEKYAGQVCVQKLPERADTVVAYERCSNKENYLCLVETGEKKGFAVAPYDCTELFNGMTYRQGKKIELAPFGVAILKELKK